MCLFHFHCYIQYPVCQWTVVCQSTSFWLPPTPFEHELYYFCWRSVNEVFFCCSCHTFVCFDDACFLFLLLMFNKVRLKKSYHCGLYHKGRLLRSNFISVSYFGDNGKTPQIEHYCELNCTKKWRCVEKVPYKFNIKHGTIYKQGIIYYEATAYDEKKEKKKKTHLNMQSKKES